MGRLAPNFHLRRHLVFRKLVGQERLELVDPKRRASRLECNEGLGRLTAISIRDADGGDLGNGGVLVNRLFNVAGKHVEAAGQDHALLAVDQGDEAVLVEEANIASVEATRVVTMVPDRWTARRSTGQLSCPIPAPGQAR
jgi:hypothetical protein